MGKDIAREKEKKMQGKRKKGKGESIGFILSFILFPLSFFLSVPVHAEDKVVTLSDLGYAKDIYLSGIHPEFSLYLPNHRGLKRAEAEMYVRFSGVLDEKSTITVLVDDVPLFTRGISRIGREPVLSFGIKLSTADYVKVTLRGYFFITGDICHDILTGNLWMVVSSKSRFIMEDDFISDSISNYFKNYDTDFNIVFDHKKVSLSVLPLIYYINKLNDWKDMRLSISDAPIEGMRNIIIGDYSKGVEVRDGNLFVSGNGVQMIKRELMPLHITSSMSNSQLNTDEANRTNEMSFADAGIKGITMTGIGDLSFNVSIRYSFFTGIPRNLYMKLMLNHTPIPKEDMAFLKSF